MASTAISLEPHHRNGTVSHVESRDYRSV
ncbi:hypothetical protein CCACVL1_11404 [Corchorus capsularis]|uniref:Uncharacterized protein n=1 Tax=Corchorus capsularis TaxID=210143 RepID=A0A1R3ILD6_COCAP|nr:hypothetical protein CCACVL1_11404 [Corchorus capsularis]